MTNVRPGPEFEGRAYMKLSLGCFLAPARSPSAVSRKILDPRSGSIFEQRTGRVPVDHEGLAARHLLHRVCARQVELLQIRQSRS